MKKEKTIRTYQRRTKTGKVVTVKQHTAKYDAAEALKEAAKKKGAGDELENLKKVKPEKAKVEKPAEDTPDYGFTADEYKAWYHWDQDADPKNKSALKVEKALKAKMGAKGYKKYFDEMSDSYSSRGHNKAFKALEASSSKETKALEQRSKDIAKMVEGQKAQMKKAGIDPDKRLSGKKATEAKKDLVSKGFTQKKDEYGDTYLMKGKDVYHYIPSGVVMGGAKLDKITGGKDYDKAKKLFGEKSVTPSKETKADSSEYGKAPKHLGMTQQEWNDWMDGGAGYKAADKKAKAHLEKLYGKEGAKAIRKKYEGDGSNKYIDLVSKATADKKVLSEIGGGSKKSSKEDDWKSAPKNSGKYLAGKQKAGAEKEGIASLGIPPKSSKEKEAHAALKEKGYKRYIYNGEVYYATKSGSLKQVDSDGRVRNVVPFKGARGTQESALKGWKRRDAEKAKAKRDKADAKKYREGLKSKGSK